MRVVKKITGGKECHNGYEQDFKRGECNKKAVVQIKRGDKTPLPQDIKKI